MSLKSFEKDMSVFSFRDHQKVLTYMRRLRKQGFTLEDVAAYVDERKSRMSAAELQMSKAHALRELMPKCPKCGKKVGLRAVAAPKGRSNRFGWRSCYECFACGWERYSRRDPQSIMHELMHRKKGAPK